MSRRVQSLHHNLGDKNMVFHREHRSKKNRRLHGLYQKRLNNDKRKKIEEIRLRELEDVDN